MCVCAHFIDPISIYSLRCVHSNKHIETHDAIHDMFIIIVQNISFHVGQEQLHELLLITFIFFHQQIDIVLTKNDIRTLIYVVIVDPTQVDLFFQSYIIQRFVAFAKAQAKKKNYRN
jgi:hypothetical protein